MIEVARRYQLYVSYLRNLLEKREEVRSYLELLLTLVAISIFAWFAIKPTLLTIIDLSRKIQNQQQIVKTLDEKLAGLKVAQQQLGGLQSDFAQIRQAMPNNPAVEIFARQVEALAAQEGVKLVNFSLGEARLLGATTTSPNYPTLTATIQGPPTNALSFLKKFESLRRAMIWDTLSLVGKPPGSAATLTITITGQLPHLGGVSRENL